MAQKHTLKKSKSKYGRTRRQRRKQRRMRMHGGEFSLAGITDGFKGLVSKFSPSTDAEKCKEANEKAEEVCSKVENENLEPSMPVDDYAATQPITNELGVTNELGDYTEPQSIKQQPIVANELVDDDYNEPQSIKQQPIVANELVGDAYNEQPIVANKLGLGDAYNEPDDYAVTLAPPSLSPLSPSSLQTPNVSGVGGGRKKSRRKNKNKKQSRRYKKSKSSKKT